MVMGQAMDRRRFQQLCATVAGGWVVGDWGGADGRGASPVGAVPFTDPAAAKAWHTWRGPGGNSIAAAGASVPDQLTADHIRWQVPVPGRGHSSPVVTESHIFITSGDRQSELQWALGFERASGRQLWQTVVHRGGIPQHNHVKNSEASPSVAFDGEHLLALFYNGDALRLTSLTVDGQIRWQENIGRFQPQLFKHGYGASPCLYGDTVIVVGDYDGEPFLTARDCRTGRLVWRVQRPLTLSYSSPIVAHTAGRNQLILSGANRVIGYDPSNGEVLWEAMGTTMATCGTVVWDEDRVYASGGYPKAETVCVRTDGSAEVLWSNATKCYEQSMLAYRGHLYAVADGGVAYCWRGIDGEMLWRQRLGGDYSSSPVLVGETIHVFSEQGTGYAFAADPTGYRELGRSQLADDCFPTPSVIGDTMYHRFARGQGGERQEFLVAMS
jgi:outer membrane protein assembly factor BamB